MIRLITDVQGPILVYIDTTTVSEGGRTARVSCRANDSSDSCNIGPIFRPSLDPIVGRVKDVDERPGDKDVRR